MMGLVVAVGIINMAETRPSSKWMCPRKMLLVLKSLRFYKFFFFNFVIQQGPQHKETQLSACAFLTPPHVSVILCRSIFDLECKILKRHLEAHMVLICFRSS